MRELIEQLKKVTENSEFGSIEWQNEMLDKIKKKLVNKEELDGSDIAFIDTQVLHNKRIMAELKTMGLPDGISPN